MGVVTFDIPRVILGLEESLRRINQSLHASCHRRQQLCKPIVAGRDPALHAGLEDTVAGIPRLVEHRLRECGLSVLLDENGRSRHLAWIPGLIELLGGDDPLRPKRVYTCEGIFKTIRKLACVAHQKQQPPESNRGARVTIST